MDQHYLPPFELDKLHLDAYLQSASNTQFWGMLRYFQCPRPSLGHRRHRVATKKNKPQPRLICLIILLLLVAPPFVQTKGCAMAFKIILFNYFHDIPSMEDSSRGGKSQIIWILVEISTPIIRWLYNTARWGPPMMWTLVKCFTAWIL